MDYYIFEYPAGIFITDKKIETSSPVRLSSQKKLQSLPGKNFFYPEKIIQK